MTNICRKFSNVLTLRYICLAYVTRYISVFLIFINTDRLQVHVFSLTRKTLVLLSNNIITALITTSVGQASVLALRTVSVCRRNSRTGSSSYLVSTPTCSSAWYKLNTYIFPVTSFKAITVISSICLVVWLFNVLFVNTREKCSTGTRYKV